MSCFTKPSPNWHPDMGAVFVRSVGVICAPSSGMCAGTLCPTHPLVLVCLHTSSNTHQHPGECCWTSPWVDLVAVLTMVKLGAAVVRWVPDRGLLPSVLELVSVDILQPNIAQSWSQKAGIPVLLDSSSHPETCRNTQGNKGVV